MFSARMIRRDPPVAQGHREEEAEIRTLSLTRRIQTVEEALSLNTNAFEAVAVAQAGAGQVTEKKLKD